MRTHGFSCHRNGRKRHPLYVVWAGMIQRCRNPKNKAFPWYGAKGVTVCKRWLRFENFMEDMGGTYKKGLTLSRKSNRRGYCKSNVMWETWKQQRLNRTDSRFWTFRGVRKTVREWSDQLRVNYNTLFYRVYRRGWSISKALTTPA